MQIHCKDHKSCVRRQTNNIISYRQAALRPRRKTVHKNHNRQNNPLGGTRRNRHRCSNSTPRSRAGVTEDDENSMMWHSVGGQYGMERVDGAHATDGRLTCIAYAHSEQMLPASALRLRAYSSSCITNPQLGAATARRALTCATAAAGPMPARAMRYAATTETERLAPMAQCTSTRAFGWERSARSMNAVVAGRWPASSANGVSCSGTTMCVRERYAAGVRASGIAERMCVIPCAASWAGSSALDRSETYTRGMISDIVAVGESGVEFGLELTYGGRWKTFLEPLTGVASDWRGGMFREERVCGQWYIVNGWRG